MYNNIRGVVKKQNAHDAGGMVGVTPCSLTGIARSRFNGYVLSIRPQSVSRLRR